jgi:hypothetical protein
LAEFHEQRERQRQEDEAAILEAVKDLALNLVRSKLVSHSRGMNYQYFAA